MWKNILKAPIWRIGQKVNLKPDTAIVATNVKGLIDEWKPVNPNDMDTTGLLSDFGYYTNEKPPGLYYSLGDGSWPDWIFGEMPRWSDRYTYVYEIHLTGNILKLTTKQEHIDFFKKYVSRFMPPGKKPSINWRLVMNEYDGIQVMGRDFHREAYIGDDVDNLKWLYGWDINGGVIWNRNGFKVGKLLFSRDDEEWEDYDEERY
mgnify:CR=1 FL=1